MGSFFTASFLLMAVATTITKGFSIEQRATCPEDYSPCSCEQNTSGDLAVTCDQIPISEIQDLFSRLVAHDLASFRLTIATTETSTIPADFLGSSRTRQLDIFCAGTSYNLVINDDAFLSSISVAKVLTINSCDLQQQPNFGFLSGFQVLANLGIFNSKNFNSLQGIPSQSQLYYISILNSRGFDNLADGPKIALPGLRLLYLYGNQLDDVAAAKILKTLAESSRESLVELRLYDNKLTRIPVLIPSLTKLDLLMMERNAISSISTRSLGLLGPMSYLQLGDNAITTIEPSAFGSGPFSNVYLHLNQLTRFDSYVFQAMLEGMIQAGSGALSLYENAIKCDCHLAWLIVHKRSLLSVIDGGQCSNSTHFDNLNPDGLKDCPVFTCPVGIDGNFPNPLSCSTYYTCTAGTSVLVNCPGGLVFNPVYQLCDWPYNVPTCNPT